MSIWPIDSLSRPAYISAVKHLISLSTSKHSRLLLNGREENKERIGQWSYKKRGMIVSAGETIILNTLMFLCLHVASRRRRRREGKKAAWRGGGNGGPTSARMVINAFPANEWEEFLFCECRCDCWFMRLAKSIVSVGGGMSLADSGRILKKEKRSYVEVFLAFIPSSLPYKL